MGVAKSLNEFLLKDICLLLQHCSEYSYLYLCAFMKNYLYAEFLLMEWLGQRVSVF